MDKTEQNKRKRGSGNAGRCAKARSKKNYSKKRKFHGKKALEKKLLDGKKLTKKPHKQRRAYKDGGRMQESSSPGSGSPVKKSNIGGSLSPRKNVQRKSLSATDAETEPENETSGETLSLRFVKNYNFQKIFTTTQYFLDLGSTITRRR